MPSEYRNPKLSKSDPMVVEHIKIPKSVLASLNISAASRQRHRSFVVREILETWKVQFDKDMAANAVAAAKSNKKTSAA